MTTTPTERATITVSSDPLPRDATPDQINQARDALVADLRAKVLAAGWNPETTGITLTVHDSFASFETTGGSFLRAEATQGAREPETAETTGLEARYDVRKINDPAGKHDSCRYFVLDPQHDPHAVVALRAYAAAARGAGLTALADDLGRWTGDQADETGIEWRTEYRVAGMTFRRGGRTLTEASSPLPVWDVADPDDDVFTHDAALGMLRGLQETRGGTAERRRVAETPWEPVEEPQDPETLNEAP